MNSQVRNKQLEWTSYFTGYKCPLTWLITEPQSHDLMNESWPSRICDKVDKEVNMYLYIVRRIGIFLPAEAHQKHVYLFKYRFLFS